MKFLTYTVCFIVSNFLFAQQSIEEELYGFQLGQYREVTMNELGEPADSYYLEDSSRVDFFYLNLDSTTHIGFIYPYNSNEIYAIQLTGEATSKGFRDLNLGSKSTDVFAVFGTPDQIDRQEFNDDSVSIYFYQDKNISFVFDDDKLNSIKIWDPFTEPNYDDKDFQLPSLEPIIKSLKNKDRSEIIAFLSPGMEIFSCDDIIKWKKSIRTEIENTDHSLFDFIFNEQYGLMTLNQYDSIPAELNLRYIEGFGSFPVYKFQSETLFEEIVFTYQQGKYKIWEIKYKCEE